jgi:hypothetical protein
MSLIVVFVSQIYVLVSQNHQIKKLNQIMKDYQELTLTQNTRIAALSDKVMTPSNKKTKVSK